MNGFGDATPASRAAPHRIGLNSCYEVSASAIEGNSATPTRIVAVETGEASGFSTPICRNPKRT